MEPKHDSSCEGRTVSVGLEELEESEYLKVLSLTSKYIVVSLIVTLGKELR